MPPPSCTGICTEARIASTARAFTGLPAKAPFEVDHVQPVEARLLEGAGLARGVGR